jgi:hypothetical protein
VVISIQGGTAAAIWTCSQRQPWNPCSRTVVQAWRIRPLGGVGFAALDMSERVAAWSGERSRPQRHERAAFWDQPLGDALARVNASTEGAVGEEAAEPGKGVQPVSSPYTRRSTELRHARARWCRGHRSSGDKLRVRSGPSLSSSLIQARTARFAKRYAGVFAQVPDGGDP